MCASRRWGMLSLITTGRNYAFVERLWRSCRSEEVYPRTCDSHAARSVASTPAAIHVRALTARRWIKLTSSGDNFSQAP